MQPDNLNVFDFDGTIIKVNSFKEISKKFIVVLIKKFRFGALYRLANSYVIRKLKIVSHLQFKQLVVGIFEKALSEKEKRNIVQGVFDFNVNKNVYDLVLNSESCIISTASPYAYVSRISFEKKIPVISSLDPHNDFPDPTNFGSGKVENIKAYFKGENIRVVNFYTDSEDDQALIDFSINAFIYKDSHITKIK
jgi:phosphoserine phosphatase